MKKLALACLLAATGFAAHANLVVTFTNASQSGGPGDVVTFYGTLSNSADGGTVSINGDTISLGGPLAFTDVFLDNAPFSLNPGETTSTFAFFSVAMPTGSTTIGTYSGSFFVLGGIDADAQDVLGSSSFSISAVPEPASAALFGLGAAVLAGMRRRKPTA